MKENFDKKIKKEVSQKEILSVLQTIGEVSELKKQAMESKEKGENYDPHFELISPEHIGVKESELWQKFKNANSMDEMEKLMEDLGKFKILVNETKDAARIDFLAFLSNKVGTKYMHMSNESKRKKQ